MHLLVITLIHKLYGPAVASWLAALRQMGGRVDHVMLWGAAPVDGDSTDQVVAKYREAQGIFLDGGWDAMVTIEDDMIVPVDALPRLERMLHGGADIAYGLYVWRHGVSHHPWSAYSSLGLLDGRSISKDKHTARAAWGSVIDVAGVGLGCTAIKRAVLEKHAFRRGGAACNDWYLALDAQQAGLVQRCDLGLVCGHMSTEPSPRVLWPDPDGEGLYRIEHL